MDRLRSRLIVLLALIASFALIAAACGDDDDTASDSAGSDGTGETLPPDGDTLDDDGDGDGGDGEGGDAGSSGGDDALVLYSGRSEDLIGPVVDRYAEATGVDVQVRYGDSAELALLISEEGDNSPADVFLSQSPGATGFLDDRGLLTALPDDVLALVDESVRDDDGRWVGISGRQRVLVYNPDLVDESELPSTIFDLTDPSWSDRLGVAPGNGSFQDFVTLMRATEGEDTTRTWLEGLADNEPLSYPKNSAIVAAVGRGEVDAGLVNHYYNVRALAEDPDHAGVNHYFPDGDPGGVLIVTAAAQLASSERSVAAADFLTYLLGTDAQQYFAEETFEYPLRTGAEPSDVVPAATFGAVGGIDFSELGGGLEATRELIATAGLEEG